MPGPITGVVLVAIFGRFGSSIEGVALDAFGSQQRRALRLAGSGAGPAHGPDWHLADDNPNYLPVQRNLVFDPILPGVVCKLSVRIDNLTPSDPVCSYRRGGVSKYSIMQDTLATRMTIRADSSGRTLDHRCPGGFFRSACLECDLRVLVAPLLGNQAASVPGDRSDE